MPVNDQPPRLEYRNSGRNPLATVLTVIAGAALLVAGFIFSLLILSVAAIVGLALWGYFWWKTRELRRHIGDQMQQMQREQQRGRAQGEPTTEGVIIEGEVIREESNNSQR